LTSPSTFVPGQPVSFSLLEDEVQLVKVFEEFDLPPYCQVDSSAVCCFD
jgi:hypothetical protein